jgi:hypothetical protein
MVSSGWIYGSGRWGFGEFDASRFWNCVFKGPSFSHFHPLGYLPSYQEIKRFWLLGWQRIEIANMLLIRSMIAAVDEKGENREVVRTLYKKVDKLGRVSIGMDLAGDEVLIIVARPKMPQDKLDYLKA